MSYLPIYKTPHSANITACSPESLGVQILTNNATSTGFISSTWVTGNKAIFIPFTLRYPTTIYGLFSANGATASGNQDIGVFAADGTKLVNVGTTAQSGTQQIQMTSITPLTIGPGLFYMALVNSATAGTYYRVNGSSPFVHQTGIYEMASALPLPAFATFVAETQAIIPVFGITTVPTGSITPKLFVNVNDVTVTSESHTP